MKMQTPWVNDWDELEEIGRGGQGVVTKVRSRSTGKLAVLKRIVDKWRFDEQARARLRQEGETLAKLKRFGAKVPELYESFIDHNDAEPFLIMEYILGDRFDSWLNSSAPTTPQTAVKITLQITRTIELCHKLDVGHRDLKPTNIILKDGNINHPYILDFGISFDSRQTVALTEEGEMFWNEFIMLPECQDLAGGHRDLRSDITALAGIFFTCLTAKPPIMLRSAEEQPPHERHEKLLCD
ncbi:MAG TPA: protein kinase, partial [Candidatus Obscuribacterales bacterium]